MADQDAVDRRWPSWVYREGVEPDYRFSFANERTFLAWIRTGLALIAAGVAVAAVDLELTQTAQLWIGGGLVLFGMSCGIAAWVRWARSEKAMRKGAPLPSFGIGATSILGLTVVSVVSLLVAVVPSVR